MRTVTGWQSVTVALLVAMGWSGEAPGHHVDSTDERLSVIGPAPDFDLTTQDTARLALKDLRGKVVAVSFMYTGCADTCPLLTAKLVGVQNALGSEFGSDVFFVSITVDPERDQPAVLKRYAEALGCDSAGWAHLTGTDVEIRDVASRYGVFRKKQPGGDVDHNLLTSIIDREGSLRVQYMGMRFDPWEFLHDLRDLLDEAPAW